MADFRLLIGTTKGAFILTSSDRRNFDVGGPHIRGREVYSLAYDRRRGRTLVGATSAHWGPSVSWSDDDGATWTETPEQNIAFPPDLGATLERVWQLKPAGPDQPDVTYAGVEPAALFRSEDAGESWSLVQGLWDHPHRPQWQPGGGGLCLHTIDIDPRDNTHMNIGISAAGHYRTTDGGATWEARNAGIKAVFMPEGEQQPEFGQCVHKFARDPGNPDTLFLQHHWGVYRSDDGGDSWTETSKKFEESFGFPMVTHPRRSGTAYVLPLESDGFRCVPDGRCQVWRTTDSGASWEALGDGLPQQGAYFTVLRDAFTGDDSDPAGLWFGTKTGQVFGSVDEGESWSLVADNLPPVLCVKAG